MMAFNGMEGGGWKGMSWSNMKSKYGIRDRAVKYEGDEDV
jgi:hypothetical protein